MVRRLPVLQEPPSAEDAQAAARSGPSWMVLGAILSFLLWLALSTIATPLGARLHAQVVSERPGHSLPAVVAIAGPTLLSFALSVLGAGFVIGRFGPRAGAWHAVGAGLLAAGASLLLSAILARINGWTLAAAGAVLGATAALSAGFGWKIGRKRLR